jgi:hypothetical protein
VGRGRHTTSTLLSWNILLLRASAPSLCSRSNVTLISLDIAPACCANALRGALPLADPFAAACSAGVRRACRDECADCFCCRFACATMLENSEVRFCMPMVEMCEAPEALGKEAVPKEASA